MQGVIAESFPQFRNSRILGSKLSICLQNYLAILLSVEWAQAPSEHARIWGNNLAFLTIAGDGISWRPGQMRKRRRAGESNP